MKVEKVGAVMSLTYSIFYMLLFYSCREEVEKATGDLQRPWLERPWGPDLPWP